MKESGSMTMAQSKRVLYPVGECYCGCGNPTSNPQNYFVIGHDQRILHQIIQDHWGSTAAFAVEHGYGPKGK